MSKQEDLEARLNALSEILERVENAFYQRDLNMMKGVNFTALEHNAAQLCDDIKAAGPEIAHALQSGMGDFISRLSELENHLEEFKNELENKNNSITE